MQDLLVHNPVGLLEIDSKLIIKLANLEAERIFGYEPKGLLNLCVDALIPQTKRIQHGKHVEQFQQIGMSRMMGDASGKQIFNGLRKDGQAAYIQIGINLIKRDGETVYLIAVSDCTELFATTESLKASNLALQMKVNELEGMKSWKNHFMTVMSHELKTPLQSTLGLIELLQEPAGIHSSEDLLEELQNCAFDIQRHVRTLTDYANSQQGVLSVHEEHCNLRTLIISELNHARKRFKAHETVQKIHIDLPAETLHMVDALRLKTVVYGLLCNSYLHANATEIQLTATLQHEGLHQQLSIQIEDNGIGIPSSIVNHIEQPFANFEKRRNSGKGGFGVGMYLHNKYVQSMKGTLVVECPRTGGTLARITIPVRFKLLPQPQNRHAAANNHTLLQSQVLLVEDDKLIAKVTLALLQKAGAEVSLAKHGQEALDIVNARPNEPFDIILMDLDMPVMNGYEATKRLRLNPVYAHTPILAITAGIESEAFPKALAAGIDYCFSKPFLPSQLLAWLNSQKSS